MNHAPFWKSTASFAFAICASGASCPHVPDKDYGTYGPFGEHAVCAAVFRVAENGNCEPSNGGLGCWWGPTLHEARRMRYTDYEVAGAEKQMDVARRVKKIVVEQLGVAEDKVTMDASFTNELGADDLDIVELLMAFEEEFRIEIPDEEAKKIGNVREAVDYIEQNMPPLAADKRTVCAMEFTLVGWSAVYKVAKGSGTITCDNGQTARVKIEAKGGGVTAGKFKIRGGHANFTGIAEIKELFGSYASDGAAAGTGRSNEAQALTKGEVSLSLTGKGTGVELGVSFGKFTISEWSGGGGLVGGGEGEEEGGAGRGYGRSGGGGEEEKDENYAVVRVFYATDRAELGSHRYGAGRGEVTYGSCRVSMPRDHRLGRLEEPSIFKLEFREDPRKHVVLLSVAKNSKVDFLREMQSEVRVKKRQALVFVHGYNVSFSNAARRTAQLKYDLAFEGPAVFYSWPSQATYTGYPRDEANIEWSEMNIQKFFHVLASELRVDAIYVVAHSMGTRGATRALNRLSGAERSSFKEVILAAPDIDEDVFRRDILPHLLAPSSRVTLYASSKDKALRASKDFHGYRRLGDSEGGVFVGAGVDSIDATAASTDFVGHSYFAENRSIIADLFYLLRDGKPIQERFRRTRPVTTAKGTYYVVRP